MLIIRRKEEMEKYYVKEVNTYVFNDNVEFLFDVEVDSHINAWRIYANNICAWNIDACNIDANNIKAYDIDASDIDAHNINAHNIDACDITANDIDAWNIEAGDIYTWNISACDIKASDIRANDINYSAVCYARYNIECNSIKGKFTNSKHFVLEGKLVVRGEENDKGK